MRSFTHLKSARVKIQKALNFYSGDLDRGSTEIPASMPAGTHLLRLGKGTSGEAWRLVATTISDWLHPSMKEKGVN
jgi:hypothetical protein